MRVHTKTKSNRGAEYHCARCRKVILPTTKYHEWSFRYGGTYRQHEECGYPKPSQLTQSKLSEVYAAQESFSVEGMDEPDDIASEMNEVAEAARSVAEEYREAVSAMNMEGSGNESEERADALESYADEIENVAGDIEGETFEVEEAEEGVEKVEGAEPKDEQGRTREEWLQELRDNATEAVNALDL